MYNIEKNNKLKVFKIEMKVDGILAKDIPDPTPDKSYNMVILRWSGSGKKTSLLNSLLKGNKSNGVRNGFKKYLTT